MHLFIYFLYLFIFPSYADCPIPQPLGNTNYHSQGPEDYILSIVFDDIDKGSYIDIGAHDPNFISVTKYFYLKGWSGINIEPLPNQYKKLLEYRPKDINLNIAIGDKEGIQNLYVLRYDAFSTFDKNIVEMWKGKQEVAETIPVNVKTLDSVLQEHPIEIIHFLNIDVEGSEKEVLLSIDLKKHRPWVMVIESLEPRTLKPLNYKWQEILDTNYYHFILFDGLNSYYIANEHYKKLYDKFLKAYNCIKSFGVYNVNFLRN